jgi:hypothetical protein
MIMKICIKHNELREFQQIIKDNNIRHGPFHKDYKGYTIDILEAGITETYLRLKYVDLTN